MSFFNAWVFVIVFTKTITKLLHDFVVIACNIIESLTIKMMMYERVCVFVSATELGACLRLLSNPSH